LPRSIDSDSREKMAQLARDPLRPVAGAAERESQDPLLEERRQLDMQLTPFLLTWSSKARVSQEPDGAQTGAVLA
jgi:hypothetical protein